MLPVTDIQMAMAVLVEGRGWTLAALSDAIGVHENTLRRWHRGEHQPANPRPVLTALERLATARVPKRHRVRRKDE
jgi:transcriptional regulator with XRE-family HTH domain